MPRKKKPLGGLPLAPLSEFEDAVKKVLGTPKQTVDEKMAEFQASNKARRLSREQKKNSE